MRKKFLSCNTLVCNQRTDCHHFCVHDQHEHFNNFLGTVVLDVSLAFAEVAKALSSFSVLLHFRFLLCGDRVHLVNLCRNGRC